jgi:hypothetical protein
MDALPPNVPKEKIKQAKGREASNQAHSYAQMMLRELHDGEIWDLAERLDVVMKKTVDEYVKEIRK